MPRRERLIAAGAAIFVAGLLASFPARVAYRWFAPEGVLLSGLSGTTWSGAATEGRFGNLYLRDLSWRFRPLALFTAKAAWSLAAQSAAGLLSGDVAIGPGGAVHVSGLRGRVPIAALGDLASFVGIDGLIQADIGTLVLDDGLPVGGSGSIEVSNLVARQLSPAPLGSYRAEFGTNDDTIHAEIRDVSGTLDLEGTLELRPDRSFLLVGKVAAAAHAPEGVARQLAFLGSPDADGMRSFRFEGTLP